MARLPLTMALVVLFCAVVGARDTLALSDDDQDFPPGLLAEYESGGRTVSRIDPDISFDWGSDAPDQRLGKGRFKAKWTGVLLVRQPGRYRIHAHVAGRVSVSLADATVLSSETKTQAWASGDEFELSFGEKELEVTFESLDETKSRLALFWSSDAFRLEPIPPYLLFRDEGHPELRQIERGRIAWDVHRCGRCHQRTGESTRPAVPGPSLTHIRGSIDHDWLIDRIQQTELRDESSRMPTFGFSREHAEAVAAFLMSRSESPKLDSPKKTKDAQKDKAAGLTLLHGTGCLACHRVGKVGAIGAWSGGNLSSIGRKRTVDWFNTWLANPARLNPGHRMPVFDLTSTERGQLALALSKLGVDDGTASVAPMKGDPDEKLVKDGELLVRNANCAVCHHIDGMTSETAKRITAKNANWSRACVGPDVKRRPHQPYFPSASADDIRAYIKSVGRPRVPWSELDRGQLVLERRNCLACHDRDGERGLSTIAGRIARTHKPLNGESEALIPPSLTAVGDKLQSDALSDAVSGRQKARRMPWLHVRMPRFEHTDREQEALMTYLTSHDRIPSDAPDSASVTPPAVSSQDNLVAGHTLVGARGLNCIACHKVGDYEPRNVALGTRGSDLVGIGKRLRPEFYLRWCRSPLRIVPGMEMPSFMKAVPGMLDDDIDAQLMATWTALNDPRFTAPTNPASVEQFFAVRPGESARIVRDVFEVPEADGGGYVARSLAIGLDNGHSALFDLDSFTLRQWTFGDMARQRTQGKSWYWDMAGVPVVRGLKAGPSFALRKKDDEESALILPEFREGTCGRLIRYRNSDHGVELEYTVDFRIGSEIASIRIDETITTIADDDSNRTGWHRRVVPSSTPDGYELLLAQGGGDLVVGSPSIQTANPHVVTRPVSSNEQAEPVRWLAAAPFKNLGSEFQISYTAELSRPDLSLKVKPDEPPKVEQVDTVPGFDGVRLPVSRSIMPTAMTWTNDGALAFTSLKGHVYLARDTDGDGIEDSLSVFEEGLAAPFGIVADGDDLIVAHKPELIRLSDTDGDGRADRRTVVATGWGYTDNYHDWTCGVVRDSQGRLYVGLGSDYAQKKRPADKARWRGAVLRIDSAGNVTPVGKSFRYPVGLAIDSADRIFVSDNQGVQNTFNEINLLQDGKHYGVPGRHEPDRDAPAAPPAIQVPHPWSRSVNGLTILRDAATESALQGHGIGCEYDSRFLVRFTTQQVGDTVQGAAYYFSRPEQGAGGHNFVGPISCAVAPNGDLYIGSIYDSGWLGGRNTGAITRLRRTGKLPNGIRELRATADGFEIEFLQPVGSDAAAKRENYSISGYTRVWGGNYSTPDSERHRVVVEAVRVSDDRKTVRLNVDRLREGFVYEVSCGRIGEDASVDLWPATGHYTMTVVPMK